MKPTTFRMGDIFDVRSVTVPIALGVVCGGIAALQAARSGMPLWVQAACVIAGVIPGYTMHLWRILRSHGWWFALLGALVAAQGFHGVEHAVQWFQYHVLRWPFFKASGIISAANAEWVHFGWNWMVLLIMAVLVAGGLRNKIAWVMLAWTIAHTAEHTYLMVRYLQALDELRAIGVSNVAAQGLPGFFGRDGWLATSDVTRSSFVCRLPGLTTAVRLDVHFWWNVGETVLLFAATYVQFTPQPFWSRRLPAAQPTITLQPEQV
ncbi:MAG: hypothetical protein RLZZ297_1133 [Chloroflexota bacterium]|jgi:hypothetical protein